MIQKIKELLQIKDNISELNSKFDETKIAVTGFTDSINSLKQEIDGLKNSQNKLVEKFNEDSDIIRETREEFRKEVNDFKIIKSRLENKLVESFEEEIKKELIPRFERLERNVRGFEELGDKVALIAKRVVDLSSELQKFCDISQSIKKEDFELTRYANNLKTMENEKLDLMRKIDSLERLVSKMRRGR